MTAPKDSRPTGVVEIHEWCGFLHDPDADPPHPCPCIREPRAVAAATRAVRRRHDESVHLAASRRRRRATNAERWGEVA